MQWLIKPIAWVYDFLAEDMVLLVGAVAAIVVAAVAVHTVRGAAGYILWAIVIAVIAISLWRTATAQTE